MDKAESDRAGICSSAIQSCLDESAIRSVLQEYAYGMDHLDSDLLGTIFTQEAEWILDGHKRVGPGNIADAAKSALDAFKSTCHIQGNARIIRDGDEADAFANVVAILVNGPGLPYVIFRGFHYRNTLVRADGRWRIARMEIEGRWETKSDSNEMTNIIAAIQAAGDNPSA